jgi:hypothetical protein
MSGDAWQRERRNKTVAVAAPKAFDMPILPMFPGVSR